MSRFETHYQRDRRLKKEADMRALRQRQKPAPPKVSDPIKDLARSLQRTHIEQNRTLPKHRHKLTDLSKIKKLLRKVKVSGHVRE